MLWCAPAESGGPDELTGCGEDYVPARVVCCVGALSW